MRVLPETGLTTAWMLGLESDWRASSASCRRRLDRYPRRADLVGERSWEGSGRERLKPSFSGLREVCLRDTSNDLILIVLGCVGKRGADCGTFETS